jgi:hypothetical protein
LTHLSLVHARIHPFPCGRGSASDGSFLTGETGTGKELIARYLPTTAEIPQNVYAHC